MAQAPSRRFGRFRGGDRKLPGARDWERSALLLPIPAQRLPELVSDGTGLPFSLATLEQPPAALPREDPAVAALLAQLTAEAARRGEYPASGHDPATVTGAEQRLEGWRELARSDDEALFARGRPPQLLTVAVRRTGRRQQSWAAVASSVAQPLRATRGTIRASTWRLDPAQELSAEERLLRVLVTEQAFAGGQRADGRVLAPDLFADQSEIVLTLFITPRPGFQTGTRNPETPVRIELPEALGDRRLIDGALARP
ncbi:MAG TPA: hypothetical protein VGG41_11755 [Solirubrobacteraceae bacterium]|jgi:hypothetical protein